MREDPAFSTPVKNFINRYTKSLDRVWTHHSISEARYDALKEVSTARKRRESGVRVILKGQHVVTGDEVFYKVVEAQATSCKKTGRKGKKCRESSSSGSNEEDMTPVDNPEPPVREIGDCIAVQH